MTWLALLAAAVQTAGQLPPGYTQPGLTIWVYDSDQTFDRMPTAGEGQVPNAYVISPGIDKTVGFDSQEGQIKETFFGRAFGWIIVPTTGKYRFRLSGDDGATLSIGGRQILDTAYGGDFADEITLALNAGPYPIEVPFYQNKGGFKLKLEWQKPGDSKLSLIPAESLRTEAGQTPVVGPGFKRWFYGVDPRRPGDGRPLAGVHPGWKLETIRPEGFRPPVGGMTFLPDGRLAICTWDQAGAIYLLSGLDGDANQVKLSTFAEGLGEPLGVAYLDGDLWVTQKGELTRLKDTDKDDKADVFEAIAGGWPASQNYHEFTFNLVPMNGKLYLSTSVPLRGGWTYYNPGSEQGYPIPHGPGSVLEVDPKTGKWSVFASGLRTPNGMGLGVDGELFVCDNQGSWLPCSKLVHVEKGGFYGHQETPTGTRKSEPPTLWLPHGEISNSPSEPVVVPSGDYRGQMLFGDVTYGGIQRCYLEKIDGVYQGAAFRMTQGLEAGVNRLVWGPDGKLYIGGIGSNGNWNHQNHRFGLQRLTPTGEKVFEYLKVNAQSDGFLVTFTEPAAAAEPKHFEITKFRYEPKEFYGGSKIDLERFEPLAVIPTTDRRAVKLQLPEMEAGFVYGIRAVDLKNAQGKEMWSTETWYTLNRVPKPADTKLEGGWSSLFDGKALNGWSQKNGSAKFTVENGEIVGRTVVGSPNSFLSTDKTFGDFELELEVKTDPTQNTGIQFRSHSVPGYQNGRVHGYQAEVDPSTRKWSGGLYDEARRAWLVSLANNPKAQAAFKNGEWNRYRIQAIGSRIQIWVNDVPTVDTTDDMAREGFIALQVHQTDQAGKEVRWRNLRIREMASKPPKGAKLISGAELLMEQGSKPLAWKWDQGALEAVPGTGNIVTKDKFNDFTAHIEFMVDDNGKTGQDNGNSGFYIGQSYEIQILNSAPRGPMNNEAGAIYLRKAPDFAMAKPAGEWQTYDVDFTAPRWENGKKVANARLTLYYNGVLVHRDVEIEGPTGAGVAESPLPRPIRIQDHGHPIRFRNFWVKPRP